MQEEREEPKIIVGDSPYSKFFADEIDEEVSDFDHSEKFASFLSSKNGALSPMLLEFNEECLSERQNSRN